MRASFSIFIALSATVVGFYSHADSINTTGSSVTSTKAIVQKQSLASLISENYADLESSLRKQITENSLSIPIDKLNSIQNRSNFSIKMQRADLNYRKMRGISDFVDSVLEIRIADETMVEAWKEGVSPLFAYEPPGDEANWQYIEAYDVNGQVHELDLYQMPNVPVFVIDSNGKKELKASLMAMQAEMNRLGITTQINADNAYVDTSSAQKKPIKSNTHHSLSEQEELNTTQLTKIRLAVDNEPWISGRAEIYAIVTGVDASRVAPQIDLVEMPYLDYDKQTYYPNQTIIFWPRYRWGAADIILMEHDDGTNYKDLAKLLVNGAEEVLKMIPDPEVQGYVIIPQITSKIIELIPDHILTNDDDFVDVYYTLLQKNSYDDRPGASGNAVASFESVTILPTE